MTWFRARFHVVLHPKFPDDLPARAINIIFKSVSTSYGTFEGKLTHFTKQGYKGFKTLASEINLKKINPVLKHFTQK